MMNKNQLILKSLCLFVFTIFHLNGVFAQSDLPLPAPCEICGAKFTHKNTYDVQITHKPNCKYYACPICGANNFTHRPTCSKYVKSSTTTPQNNPSNLDPLKTLNSAIDLLQTPAEQPKPNVEEDKKKLAEKRAIEEQILKEKTKQLKAELKPLEINAGTKAGTKSISFTVSVEAKGKYYFLSKEGNKLNNIDGNKFILENGCKIVTESDAKVKILLPDNTMFTVGPNSEIIIDDFVYDTDVDVNKITARLLKGAFRWITGKVAEKREAKLAIKLIADLGIRGTNFIAAVNSDESAFVILFEGKVEIETTGSHEKVILTPGKKIYITADGKIDSLEKFQVMPSDIEPNE